MGGEEMTIDDDKDYVIIAIVGFMLFALGFMAGSLV
jgi:hypothetical protein